MASLNVYEMVTERIIKQLEQGTIPWQKPWTGVRSGTFNRVSKKPYSLINQAILEKPGEYASFHQWKNLGGHIKKGAKSEIIVFWKIIDVEEKNDKGEIEKKKLPLLRYYNVFQALQPILLCCKFQNQMEQVLLYLYQVCSERLLNV